MANSPIFFFNSIESQDYGPFPQLECCGADNLVLGKKKASLTRTFWPAEGTILILLRRCENIKRPADLTGMRLWWWLIAHCMKRGVENVKVYHRVSLFLHTAVDLTCTAMYQFVVLKPLCHASNYASGCIIRGKRIFDPLYSIIYICGQKE